MKKPNEVHTLKTHHHTHTQKKLSVGLKHCLCGFAKCSLYEFLGFEVLSEVQNLPSGKTEETAHGENGKVQHSGICRFICVSHLKIKKRSVIFQVL